MASKRRQGIHQASWLARQARWANSELKWETMPQYAPGRAIEVDNQCQPLVSHAQAYMCTHIHAYHTHVHKQKRKGGLPVSVWKDKCIHTEMLYIFTKKVLKMWCFKIFGKRSSFSSVLLVLCWGWNPASWQLAPVCLSSAVVSSPAFQSSSLVAETALRMSEAGKPSHATTQQWLH